MRRAHATSMLKRSYRPKFLDYYREAITVADVPASWQEATPEERSHDSRIYGARFMLRLDETSQTKLEHLMQQFGASKAAIIRQLLVQAKPEDFPKSWHMRATEHSILSVQQQMRHHRELTE